MAKATVGGYSGTSLDVPRGTYRNILGGIVKKQTGGSLTRSAIEVVAPINSRRAAPAMDATAPIKATGLIQEAATKTGAAPLTIFTHVNGTANGGTTVLPEIEVAGAMMKEATRGKGRRRGLDGQGAPGTRPR